METRGIRNRQKEKTKGANVPLSGGTLIKWPGIRDSRPQHTEKSSGKEDTPGQDGCSPRQVARPYLYVISLGFALALQ